MKLLRIPALGLLVTAFLLLAVVPGGAAPGDTIRVSVDSAGNEGNGVSFQATISGDGRYVAFVSEATNLVPGDTNGVQDTFVHDTVTGTTERVSVDSAGTQAVGGDSRVAWRSISEDGRYVVMYSWATNLVPADTNGVKDTFVHDRETGMTERVSVDSAGNQGNGTSGGHPVISADGRYVAFVGWAANLVPNDTNNTNDIFVHDRETGATTRVSVSSAGGQADGASLEPAISGDGHYVAFRSYATNLVPGDTNGEGDAFVHDCQTGVTERVSVSSDGGQGNGASGPFATSLNADGRYVAFFSEASNLVPDDTNGEYDVFVRDRESGVTERVSVDSAGNQGNGPSQWPAISADGRYVAFPSGATNLVAGDTNNAWDIFLHDRQAGTTKRLSLNNSGDAANSHSYGVSLSTDVSRSAFQSYASNLVPGDGNMAEDVFLHERGEPTPTSTPSPTPTPPPGSPTPTPTPTATPTPTPTPTSTSTPTPTPTPCPDSDGDGFTDCEEAYLGTDPADDCPDDATDDAWPCDFDMNTVVNLGDVFNVLPPHFGSSPSNPDTNGDGIDDWSPRRDLVPDGFINLGDVFMVLPPYFGSNCT